jgi:hypothetical protein
MDCNVVKTLCRLLSLVLSDRSLVVGQEEMSGSRNSAKKDEETVGSFTGIY